MPDLLLYIIYVIIYILIKIILIKEKDKNNPLPTQRGQNADAVKTKPLLPNDAEPPQTQIANVTPFAFFF